VQACMLEALLCGLLRSDAMHLHGCNVEAVADWLEGSARGHGGGVSLCVEAWMWMWRNGGRPTTTGRLRHQCARVEKGILYPTAVESLTSTVLGREDSLPSSCGCCKAGIARRSTNLNPGTPAVGVGVLGNIPTVGIFLSPSFIQTVSK